MDAERDWIDLRAESTLVYRPPGGQELTLPLPAGISLVYTSDLRLLWDDRADWRAFALTLKERGLWQPRE